MGVLGICVYLFVAIVAYVLVVAGLIWLGEKGFLGTRQGIQPALEVGLTTTFASLFVPFAMIVLLFFAAASIAWLGGDIPMLRFEVFMGMYALSLLAIQTESIQNVYDSSWRQSVLVALAPTLFQVLCVGHGWIYIVNYVTLLFEGGRVD